jgi:hypothetical protein
MRISLRVPLTERLLVGALSLVATYAFFYEYLPPQQRIHLFSDIEGFHYPLQRLAFDGLKAGRFPQWDPSIYCGITLVGNVQAAILYPPAWLMYAAAWSYNRIPYKAVEYFAFAHVWAAFLLTYCWLRARRLTPLACTLGGGVFAYGGYMASQLVHLGAISAMTWTPLGLWGIDEAVERRHWRPLWKTALASALAFLAGYPASWLVLCGTCLLYALMSREHWRAAAGVVGAVAASILLAMAQWLPALEATRYLAYAEKYGGGIKNWRELLEFVVPNWFDYNRHTTRPYPDAFYLYVGFSAIFAVAWALRRRELRPYLQALVPAAVCLLLATNPFYLVYDVMTKIPTLERVLQSYNFYEGVAAMAALVTAIAINDFLTRPAQPLPGWLAPASIVALAAWAANELRLFRHGGSFPIGGRALAQTVVGVVLFTLALWIFRAASGRRRVWMAVALLLSVGIDYKTFGTNRSFNTGDGDADLAEDPEGIRGFNPPAYREIWANRDYRMASDEGASPNPTDFRKWGLAEAQGFDPFLPAQYHDTIEHWVPFQTNRLFWLDLQNDEMLQTLGIRYIVTHQKQSHDAWLTDNPNYRLIGEDTSYYRIYEYLHARRPARWENGEGEAEPVAWLPEHRVVKVDSENGGRFLFIEQFFPGWRATVDGRPAPIERWGGSFQAIQVGPGEHTLAFDYRSRWLLPGAVVSLAAWTVLIWFVLTGPRRKQAPPLRWLELGMHVGLRPPG